MSNWTQVKREDPTTLPPIDTPVLGILAPWYPIVPVARREEGDGWGWLWHIWNGLGGIEEVKEYDCGDDYHVRYWMPLPEKPPTDSERLL